MNTIAKRRELLDIQMRDFEKGRDYAYVAGFYSKMIETLAADKMVDFEYVMNMLKRNGK
jgi:hypothetical protein